MMLNFQNILNNCLVLESNGSASKLKYYWSGFGSLALSGGLFGGKNH